MGCGSSKKNDAVPATKKEEIEELEAEEVAEKKPKTQKKNENKKKEEPVQPQVQEEEESHEEQPQEKQPETKQTKVQKQKPAPVKTEKKEVAAQERKPNLNISELGELPLYKQENPKFEFKDGELSPITTPTKKEIRQDQSSQQISENQMPQAKRVVIRRQKTTQFNWVNSGSVEIKTISFKIKYSHTLRGFKVLKSKENYQTTLLVWNKNEEEDVFEFTMRDVMITELRTGINTDVESPEIQFTVDPDGRFVTCDKITNIDEFLEKTLIIQGKELTITAKARKRMKKLIESEVHKNWKLFVENWIHLNKPEAQELVVGNTNQFGKECCIVNISNIKDEDEIKQDIKAKLMDEKTYYQYLGSKNMLLDKNKHWELTRDSKQKPVQKAGPPHRNIRLEFFLTTKYDLLTALIDPYTIRPYITNYENIKKVVFDINRDMYINLEYEAQTNVFLWNDLENIDSDDFLISEMVKFQDSCTEALQDMISELSDIKRVPLAARYEKPKEIEEIEEEEEEKGTFDTTSTKNKYIK